MAASRLRRSVRKAAAIGVLVVAVSFTIAVAVTVAVTAVVHNAIPATLVGAVTAC